MNNLTKLNISPVNLLKISNLKFGWIAVIKANQKGITLKMSDFTKKLFTEERREEIAKLLYKQQRITVLELSERFSVSKVTIRKDLVWLEKQSFVFRTYGGAILNSSSGSYNHLFSKGG